MHIYTASRGIKHEHEKFWRDLSAQPCLLPMKNKKTGKIYNLQTQVHVRPVLLHEVVFPKEYLDVMLHTLFPQGVSTTASKFQKVFAILRKIIGLKPLPKAWKTDKKFFAQSDAVERMGVGIKDDETMDFVRSKEVYKQLGLPNGEYESEGL